jgi:two-component system, OmpR family, response regulator
VIPRHMLNILVAEDDPGIQTLLRTILTREGFAVDCVADGTEALQRLGATRYDVILLDLMMPNLSGADLIARLADANDDALSRVIVITAAALHDARSFHRLPVLRKPFDLDELRSRVYAVAEGERPAAAFQFSGASPIVNPSRVA